MVPTVEMNRSYQGQNTAERAHSKHDGHGVGKGRSPAGGSLAQPCPEPDHEMQIHGEPNGYVSRPPH